LVKLVVDPTQTVSDPPIASGKGLTVTVVVVIQPVVRVYVIVAVPGVMPVTTLLTEPIVATAVLPLVHVPPVVALASVVVSPTHTAVPPVIAAGSGLIVTIFEIMQPVPTV
jgi:hypothetical protein